MSVPVFVAARRGIYRAAGHGIAAALAQSFTPLSSRLMSRPALAACFGQLIVSVRGLSGYVQILNLRFEIYQPSEDGGGEQSSQG